MVGGRAPDELVRRRVVKLGPCSAVLVSERVLVTSAHCLAWPVREVDANGDVIKVASCSPHPDYVEGRVTHDIATCRLERSASVGPLSLESAALVPASSVSMAGYGRTGAGDVGDARLRQVDTQVTAVRPDCYVVGTAGRTACSGDSGGPVFVLHEGELRLAAIVNGAAGARCEGSAEAVPLAPHQPWLEQAITHDSQATTIGMACAIVGASLVLVVAARLVGRART